jgi:hypothetical protein
VFHANFRRNTYLRRAGAQQLSKASCCH